MAFILFALGVFVFVGLLYGVYWYSNYLAADK
jgi:hypothetical protein